MADFEDLLKRQCRQNEKIITLLEQLVALNGGPVPEEKPAAPARSPASSRDTVSVVPRGRITPRYSAEEMQHINPHERSRYE
jgi:hypothetical protein